MQGQLYHHECGIFRLYTPTSILFYFNSFKTTNSFFCSCNIKHGRKRPPRHPQHPRSLKTTHVRHPLEMHKRRRRRQNMADNIRLHRNRDIPPPTKRRNVSPPTRRLFENPIMGTGKRKRCHCHITGSVKLKINGNETGSHDR